MLWFWYLDSCISCWERLNWLILSLVLIVRQSNMDLRLRLYQDVKSLFFLVYSINMSEFLSGIFEIDQMEFDRGCLFKFSFKEILNFRNFIVFCFLRIYLKFSPSSVIDFNSPQYFKMWVKNNYCCWVIMFKIDVEFRWRSVNKDFYMSSFNNLVGPIVVWNQNFIHVPKFGSNLIQVFNLFLLLRLIFKQTLFIMYLSIPLLPCLLLIELLNEDLLFLIKLLLKFIKFLLDQISLNFLLICKFRLSKNCVSTLNLFFTRQPVPDSGFLIPLKVFLDVLICKIPFKFPSLIILPYNDHYSLKLNCF